MSELICAIDVGTTKICALIGELDEENNLRIIGASRARAAGLRRAVVVNTTDATAAIGQAAAAAEKSAGQVMESAFVGIAGTHISAIGSKGVVAAGRNGRSITREDIQRALEQARNIARGQAAGRGVVGMNPNRFAALDLTVAADLTVIHLAMQAGARLVRNHVQGIARGDFAAEPFDRLEPSWMARAVVISETIDIL